MKTKNIKPHERQILLLFSIFCYSKYTRGFCYLINGFTNNYSTLECRTAFKYESFLRVLSKRSICITIPDACYNQALIEQITRSKDRSMTIWSGRWCKKKAKKKKRKRKNDTIPVAISIVCFNPFRIDLFSDRFHGGLAWIHAWCNIVRMKNKTSLKTERTRSAKRDGGKDSTKSEQFFSGTASATPPA